MADNPVSAPPGPGERERILADIGGSVVESEVDLALTFASDYHRQCSALP